MNYYQIVCDKTKIVLKDSRFEIDPKKRVFNNTASALNEAIQHARENNYGRDITVRAPKVINLLN